MVSPTDVVAFHAKFDTHPGDRVDLFRAIAGHVGRSASVLYPGCFVDIAPSVWFGDVQYLDMDRRAARFFGEHDAVGELLASMRGDAGVGGAPTFGFHHGDYREPLPFVDASFDVVVSLFAGFVGEHCGGLVRPGGLLIANNSHGDASMASIDPRFEPVAVIVKSSGRYRIRDSGLDDFLEPKRGHPPTVDELHELGRGIAYTKPAFAYCFRRS